LPEPSLSDGKKPDFVWHFLISKKSERCQKARISKFAFKNAKLATLDRDANK